MGHFSVEASVLEQLRWHVVVDALDGSTATPWGSALARGELFYEAPVLIERSLKGLSEVRGLLQESLGPDWGTPVFVESFLERAAKGGILEPQELLLVAKVIRTVNKAHHFGSSVRERCPLYYELCSALTPHAGLSARIMGAIDDDGRIRDDASDELFALRERVRILHRKMRAQVDVMLKSEEMKEVLQDDFFTVRGERYVLPIRSNMRSRVPGIVHNASNSGETVFIEPDELIRSGNELTVSQSLVVEEERKILAEFSGDLKDVTNDLFTSLEVLGKLDLLWAKAHLANRMGAVTPQIVEADESWELRELRHPELSLSGGLTIGNTLAFEKEQKALIISGPNAGGKTVAMTSVGLAALMLRAGLPIPALKGSRMPLFRDVFSSIGDEQDLDAQLSTFSGHVKALHRMLERAVPGALILIDELASGTDPSEGAALGQAIAEGLVDSGATVFLTTHLDALKAMAVQDSRFCNASLGFDLGSMKPNYRVTIGEIGKSNAIDVAETFGLDSRIVAKARSYLNEQGPLQVALKQLHDSRMAVEKEREEAQRLKVRLKKDRDELDALRETVRLERKSLEASVRKELSGELDDLREKARGMIRDLQSQPSMAKAQEIQKVLEAQSEHQRKRVKRTTVIKVEPGKKNFKEGERVYWPKMKQEGEIVSFNGDEVQLQVGAMKIRVHRNELQKLRQSEPKRKDKIVQVKVDANWVDDESGASEIHLRGMDRDDARVKLERFIDSCYHKGLGMIRVVHGLGTGALKKQAWEVLGTSPFAKRFYEAPSDQGGAGVTIVELDG